MVFSGWIRNCTYSIQFGNKICYIYLKDQCRKCGKVGHWANSDQCIKESDKNQIDESFTEERKAKSAKTEQIKEKTSESEDIEKTFSLSKPELSKAESSRNPKIVENYQTNIESAEKKNKTHTLTDEETVNAAIFGSKHMIYHQLSTTEIEMQKILGNDEFEKYIEKRNELKKIRDNEIQPMEIVEDDNSSSTQIY